MAEIVQKYTKVKYRNAAGRVMAVTVLGVTSQTVLDLRLGRANGGSLISGASKVNRKGSTVGWFQGGC